MEPNKFEKHLKKELSSRTIEPSTQAWDRLDAMLSIVENKPSKSYKTAIYKWIAIAAVITLTFSMILFIIKENNQNIPTPNHSIVTTKNTVVKQHDSLPNTAPSTIESAVENPFFTEKNKIAHKPLKKTIINEQLITSTPHEETANVIAEHNVNSNTINTKKTITVDANELLLSVDNTNAKKTNYRVRMNANSLLAQADKEVEISFREKMLQKINKNYQEVKVAIINRNKE